MDSTRVLDENSAPAAPGASGSGAFDAYYKAVTASPNKVQLPAGRPWLRKRTAAAVAAPKRPATLASRRPGKASRGRDARRRRHAAVAAPVHQPPAPRTPRAQRVAMLASKGAPVPPGVPRAAAPAPAMPAAPVPAPCAPTPTALVTVPATTLDLRVDTAPRPNGRQQRLTATAFSMDALRSPAVNMLQRRLAQWSVVSVHGGGTAWHLTHAAPQLLPAQEASDATPPAADASPRAADGMGMGMGGAAGAGRDDDVWEPAERKVVRFAQLAVAMPTPTQSRRWSARRGTPYARRPASHQLKDVAPAPLPALLTNGSPYDADWAASTGSQSSPEVDANPVASPPTPGTPVVRLQLPAPGASVMALSMETGGSPTPQPSSGEEAPAASPNDGDSVGDGDSHSDSGSESDGASACSDSTTASDDGLPHGGGHELDPSCTGSGDEPASDTEDDSGVDTPTEATPATVASPACGPSPAAPAAPQQTAEPTAASARHSASWRLPALPRVTLPRLPEWAVFKTAASNVKSLVAEPSTVSHSTLLVVGFVAALLVIELLLRSVAHVPTVLPASGDAPGSLTAGEPSTLPVVDDTPAPTLTPQQLYGDGHYASAAPPNQPRLINAVAPSAASGHYAVELDHTPMHHFSWAHGRVCAALRGDNGRYVSHCVPPDATPRGTAAVTATATSDGDANIMSPRLAFRVDGLLPGRYQMDVIVLDDRGRRHKVSDAFMVTSVVPSYTTSMTISTSVSQSPTAC